MLVQINAEWQNLNTLSGVAVGNAMILQSQSNVRVYLKQQSSQPESGSVDAIILDFGNVWQVTQGSPITWIRCAATAGQVYVETA